MASVWRSLLHSTRVLNSHVQLSSPPPTAAFRTSVVFLSCQNVSFPKLTDLSSSSCYHHRYPPTTAKTSPGSDGLVVAEDDPEDGVSLGTMKLPSDTDLQRFESLLFQWANSLCQGANLPLPVPLKVDKIGGGVRLGFITIDDGKTEVLVYIDCLVFPAGEGSGPIFRAIRNGAMKDQPPPGEPRIMRSLLQALQMSVDIAKL